MLDKNQILLQIPELFQIYQNDFLLVQLSRAWANFFGLKEFGNIYTRINESTTECFRKSELRFWKGGVAAVATKFWSSAQFF